jgi:cardiolipin synthase
MNNWTVPNILTFVRILLAPGFVVAFQGDNFFLAGIIFICAGITDALDGFLARILDQRSRLGMILDPLADKILLVSAFFCLAWNQWLPVWLAFMVVSRDLIIVGGMGLLYFMGMDITQRIQPTFLSKVNTGLQILLVFAAFILNIWGIEPGLILSILVGTVILSTLLSGGQYLLIGYGHLSAEVKSPGR